MYLIENINNEFQLKRAYGLFLNVFQGKSVIENNEYQYDKWLERLKNYPELLIYAFDGDKILGIVFGRLNCTTEITIGPLAVHNDFRNKGIARNLMQAIEFNARKIGVNKIKLGAEKSAEGFYERIGYKGSLLIQSQCNIIDEIKELLINYKLKFTNIYNNGIDLPVYQACFELDEKREEIEKLCKEYFKGCHTQIIYQKEL